MKRRSLTPDEEKLWNEVTRGDKKLPRCHAAAVTSHQSPVTRKKEPQAIAPVTIHPVPGDRRLVTGDYSGIDRNTANRFRKGELPIDATLDLHGMNREKAYNALMKFIHNQYASGSRCVLVITGKGVKSLAEEGRGILREMLPGWLGLPDIQPMILALGVSKPKHGGSGAWYVLLRRKRQPRGT